MINKIKKVWLLSGLGLLILIDMVGVNQRYLNNDNFVRAKKADIPFTASVADNYILKDNNPDFRVLDITKSTFNDASCSYFHKSIGGYHGAKLQRYQDLIEAYIQPEIGAITGILRAGLTKDKLDNTFANQQVLNMLNMKYIIYSPEAMPLVNNSAFGNAWFAADVIMVPNADEEIAALGKNNLENAAIINQQFAAQLEGKSFAENSNSIIEIISYAPNHLVYDYKSSTEQLVVFSEIYYSKGWDAYVDGEKVPYFRANYVLRALAVPGGEHSIEFKFEPRVWVIGERISFVGSLLLILLIIVAAGSEIKKIMEQKKQLPTKNS